MSWWQWLLAGLATWFAASYPIARWLGRRLSGRQPPEGGPDRRQPPTRP